MWLRITQNIMLVMICFAAHENSANAQVFKIDEAFEQDVLSKNTFISEVFNHQHDSLRQKRLNKLIFIVSKNEKQCNLDGCKTLIIDSSNIYNPYEVLLSNGEFYVSDSFTSNLGNGPSITFYQNNSRQIIIKFLDKYRIIQ